jgi:hypothetical protein
MGRSVDVADTPNTEEQTRLGAMTALLVSVVAGQISLFGRAMDWPKRALE